MARFVLVTEGITDQVALESILYGYYDESDVEVQFLQPVRDATDRSRQGDFAGWELVLEYCSKTDVLQEALQFNDFLLIQIDTDCAEHVNFGLQLTEEGKDKPVEQIINEVKALLILKLGESFYSDYADRVLFAISVHSLECWLLPLYADSTKNATKVKSCEGHLSRFLGKKDIEYAKDYDCYMSLSKSYEKKKNIEKYRSMNGSFDIFLSSLPVLD